MSWRFLNEEHHLAKKSEFVFLKLRQQRHQPVAKVPLAVGELALLSPRGIILRYLFRFVLFLLSRVILM